MSSTPVQSFNRNEPIPGYHTQERIGAGGFGEVWRTHAPGGLVKAIKIVFGQHDPRRAARELRSLNRIKQARHPFLLSIERIEIADGNLVIVTELADANLKQRFDQFLLRGHRGIPRQELLAYLSDAADGLDYIYSQFSLQHLDVKPENLLLVADRVKVADFGLAKNIYDRSVSLVEGLTPTYAPPEVFDGRPHRNSDQYSLAIVYQDMLTGQLPFDGTTAAQLASQHLHAAPSLAALPKAEQPIIARALSKDPDARFPNCRTFIDQLRQVQNSSEPGSAATALPGDSELDGERKAGESLDDDFGNSIDGNFDRGATQRIVPRMVLEPRHTETTESAAATGPASPIQIDLDSLAYYPTIFVGVGGLATQVLRKLRRRLCDRFGSLAAVPTVAMLALDTDVRALNSAMQAGSDGGLAEHETLAVPLRSPQDYRSRADRILGWLSRRWLYNIPKNLQTDGLRPLGRLALVDHGTRVRTRLAQLIDEVTRDENLQKARRESKLNIVAGAPRVYVIASVSGATGGGMFLDLAYLLRTLLSERKMSDDEVHGMLLTAASRSPQQREKALASAQAALAELWHYSRPGSSYPGERACGIPPFHGNNRTFGSCYLLQLGDKLNEPEVDTAIDPIAEYLYCSTVTPGSAFFAQARQADQASAQPMLRTFGLCQLGGSNSPLPNRMADQLCQQLILRWRSGEEPSNPKSTLSLTRPTELLAAHHKSDARYRGVERLATEQILALGMDVARIERQVREMLRQEMGNETAAYFSGVIHDALHTGADSVQRTETLMRQVVQVVDVLLADSPTSLEGTSQAQFDNLNEVLQTRVEVRAGELGHALRDWLFGLLENPQLRVEGAMRAGEWLRRHLRDLENRAATLAGQIKQSVFAAKEALLADCLSEATSSGRERRESVTAQRLTQIESSAKDYAHLRVEEVVHRAVCKFLRSSDAHVTQALDQLQELWHELNRFAGRFEAHSHAGAMLTDNSVSAFVQNHWRLLQNDLEREQGQLVAHLDRIAEQQLLGPMGGLRHFLAKTADLDKELFLPLQFGARMLTVCHMRSTSGTWLLGQCKSQQKVDMQQLGRWIEACIPPLGGTSQRSRLLLVLANSLRSLDIESRLASMAALPVSVVYAQETDLLACCEVESLTFAPLLAALTAEHPRIAAIAERLHTRVDVDWQKIDQYPPHRGNAATL